MRNLKKILALVLALVMSLSLMATAGAADFPDVKDDTSFKTAIDVLSGLGVFNGYKEDGTFRPDGEITRAETAAIIYRIVTGDVKDEQVGIYADYGLFKDVPATSWYAGYVNFCANAEYIKGDGNGKFSPNDKVEGYAALAMILRAIGYTANGGFTGSDWRVQTARVGEARKITKNITTGTLGANADRKTVAEILYQAIMVNMVDHNVDNTFNGNQGYSEINETLGQKTFGLEYVSGVILANEWANLEGDEILAADTTKMQVTTTYATESKIAKDAVLTLNSATEPEMQAALDAVGLTYNAHIAHPTATTAEVITLDKSDVNVVAYNEGKGVYTANASNNNLNNATWTTIAKLAEEENLVTDADTEWFINYSDEWYDEVTSEYRISYAIAKESLKDLPNVKNKEAWRDYIAELDKLTNSGTIPTPANSDYPGHYLGERKIKIDLDLNGTIEANETIDCYVVAISPKNIINSIDLDIMREIFYTADRIGTNGTVTEQLQNYAVGEVYVGTTSMKDYSDTMSWTGFQEEYFTKEVNTEKFTTCEIGNSLRVIDNNNDGVAEYVLRIDYTQDKIVGTYKNALVCNSVAFADFNEAHLYNPENVADNGAVVNYVVIDKKLNVWPAKVVTDSITNKNFQKITVTTASGDEYNQSGITNETRMDENIMLMNQNTQYNMYMDVYEINIRSYELAQGSKYALLTEMYPTKDYNASYVQNIGAIAEVKIGEADVTEYPVVLNTNSGTLNPFFSRYIWTWGARAHSGADAWTGVIPTSWLYNANYLQPAVAHLNISAVTGGNPSHVISPAVNPGWTDNDVDNNYTPNFNANNGWWRYTAEAQPYSNWANGNGSQIGVFDYDNDNATFTGPADNRVLDDANAEFSFTNVAAYVDNDGTLTLKSASKLATNRANGAQLYRVSTAAADAVPAFVANATAENKAMVSLWGHGTEAQLVEAYNQATGTTGGQAWFNAYTSASYNNVNYQDGTGIYPIYETDYVQLDLTKGDMGEVLASTDLVVKPGIRHFHINDNYSKYYNANSNEYVDATIDTEFYIVLPGTTANTIMYKVGYADLPNIEVNKIRAAYAVANNTSADSNSRDYWIADVVVIEVTELTYDYDSIGLVYYNPFVQDGYTRYADTLNNEWRNLQPDYDGKAMMGITPKRGFTDINWGDASWSIGNEDNYKFWRLYQTELTQPGQLAVTSAKAIDEDYNTYGIYAGTATRIEGLQTSAYIDVSTKNTGFVQTYAIDVDYGENGEVPFYTISGSPASYGRIYTAKQVNVSNTLRYSDVKNGDKLIWVYDKVQNRIAFVVDLDSRANGYSQPAWLLNLYNDIIADQGNSGSGVFDINGLIDRAEKVNTDANATLKDWNDMIKELNDALANPNVTMNNAQRTRFDAVLNALQNKAFAGNKTAALNAAQALANQILVDNASAPAGVKTPVSTALGSVGGSGLLKAIADCTTPAQLEELYKNGELVFNAGTTEDPDTTVDALGDAVQLAKDKIAAIAVATKAVTDAGLKVTDGSVSTEYTAVVNAIAACTAKTNDPLTADDVDFYAKDGKLVDQSAKKPTAPADPDYSNAAKYDLVKDLKAAITAAVGTKDLADAKTDALKKADDLVPAEYKPLVGTELTALTNAITAVADHMTLTNADKLTVLNAINAGNWDSLNGTTNGQAIWDAYNALITKMAEVKDTAEENAAFDEAVKPDEGGIQGGDNANKPDNGSSYSEAYDTLGVKIAYVGDSATITVSQSAADAVKANPMMYATNLTTMVNQGTLGGIGSSSSTVIPLFVGVHIDVPSDAKGMKQNFSDGAPLPAGSELGSAGAKERKTDLSDDFNRSGLNNWYKIGTVKVTKDGSGNVTFSDVSFLQIPTEYMYVQFYKDANCTAGQEIGSILEFVGKVEFR